MAKTAKKKSGKPPKFNGKEIRRGQAQINGINHANGLPERKKRMKRDC